MYIIYYIILYVEDINKLSTPKVVVDSDYLFISLYRNNKCCLLLIYPLITNIS